MKTRFECMTTKTLILFPSLTHNTHQMVGNNEVKNKTTNMRRRRKTLRNKYEIVHFIYDEVEVIVENLEFVQTIHFRKIYFGFWIILTFITFLFYVL